MEVYRYELFDHTAQASVTVGEHSDDAAQVEVFVNAPILKRIIVRWRCNTPSWLRGKVTAQASVAVFAPSPHRGIWSAVVRCGFLDRVVGDVPIAWEWYSDGRKIDRAAKRAARVRDE